MTTALEPTPGSSSRRMGPPQRQLLAWAALVTLVAAGLLLNLGVRPLEFEEPRRGVVALEMALRGNWIVPTTNGVTYLNKPPVFNWVLLAFMRLFGSTAEWVLRLPTVASMLLLAIGFWRFSRRHLGPDTALTASAFLLTFTTLLFYGSLYGEIDVFYALLVVVHGLSVFALEQRGSAVATFTASYALTALGFLTKGMPSLVVQALTVSAWLLYSRRWRWLLSWAHLAGLATFALCVGGYLAAYSIHAPPGPYLTKLLFDATERTAAAGRFGAGRIALQLLGFPLQLLALAAPWSVFLPGLFTRGARERLRTTPLLRFCVVFLAANVAPYWLSPGNRPRYMFLFLPFLAALLAVALEELAEEGWYAPTLRVLMGAVLVLAALAAAAYPFTPWAEPMSPAWAWPVVTALLAGLAVWCWRAGSLRARCWPVLLALAAARLGYDLVVPAHRRANSPDVFYEQVVEALNREHPAQPILLLGEVKPRVYAVPITGPSFSIPEYTWFSFSLTFHYTASRGELLRYAGDLEPGKLYLAHADFSVGAPHEVVRVFDNPRNRAEDLKLLRVRD